MPDAESTTLETEVLVVGGGPGGYAAAFRAADLGKQVALVDERDHLGGVCLLEGCVPTKAMISAANLVRQIGAAGQMGIDVEGVSIHMQRLAAWRDRIVGDLCRAIEGLAKRRNVKVYRGRAILEDGHRARLETEGLAPTAAAPQAVRFQQAVLAPGAKPVFPAGLGPDGGRVLGSREALSLTTIPDRLLVVGGGYIGLELGTCFALLGSRVTLVEMTDSLLPGTDADLVAVVQEAFGEMQGRLYLSAKVAALTSKADRVEARIEVAGQGPLEETYDYALVAAGRKPNTTGLGLEAAGIESDERGFVAIDRQCRTSAGHVFAVGDCTPGPMLAHRARHQGIVAAEALAGRPTEFDPATVPAVVFCYPEIAYCGMSEPEAREQGYTVKVGRFHFRGSSRAMARGDTKGFVKIVADAATERVLGVRMVGEGVSELVSEAALAIEMGARLEDVEHTIHVHPTLGEAIEEAAAVARGTALHFYRPPRKS